MSISGRDFINSPFLSCMFGDQVVKASFETKSRITCTTPADKSKTVDFYLSSNGVDYQNSGHRFHYLQPIVINKVYPQAGPVSGQTSVKIEASNLKWSPSLGCRFNDTFVKGTLVNQHVLICKSPKMDESGFVSLSVTSNGQDFSVMDTNFRFFYFPIPDVESLVPITGFKSGGTGVNVTLSHIYVGLNAPRLFCLFGNSMVSAVVTTNTIITCQLPPQEGEISTIRTGIVFDQSFDSYPIPGPDFTYNEGVIVTHISPTSGTHFGGTLVNVYGKGFTSLADMQCDFVDVSKTPAHYVNESYLTCLSPPADSISINDTVAVEVLAPSQDLRTLYTSAKYKYFSRITLSHIEPNFGSRNGGTMVFVHGSGFSSGDSRDKVLCRFGSTIPPVHGLLIDDSLIKCKTPQLMDPFSINKLQHLSISLNDGHDYHDNESTIFAFVDPIYVVSMSTSLGSTLGGTHVSLRVQGLDINRTRDIMCHFGLENPVPATFLYDEDTLACVSPPNVDEDVVELFTSVNGGNDLSGSNLYFSYYRPPSIVKIEPNHGTYGGGEQVYLFGSGFLNSKKLACKFGNITSIFTKWISDKRVMCITPPFVITHGTILADTTVQITNDGIDFFPSLNDGLKNDSILFHYSGIPIVLSANPVKLSCEGGTKVTLKGEHKFEIMLYESGCLNLTLCFVGAHLDQTTMCQFGEFGRKTSPLIVNSNQVICIAPRAGSTTCMTGNNDFNKTLYISYGHGLIDTGISFEYVPRIDAEKLYALTLDEIHLRPHLDSVEPNSLGSYSYEHLRILGSNFTNQVGLGCILNGTNFIEARFISSDEILCKIPYGLSPGIWNLSTVNGRFGFNSINALDVLITEDVSILSISPKIGPPEGGTTVSVIGQYPWGSEQNSLALCYFENEKVIAKSVSYNVSISFYRRVTNYLAFLNCFIRK